MTPKKQERFLKRVIALCMAAALLFTSVWYDTPQVYAKSSEPLTGLDAQAIVKQIKIGWNLGNSLDAVSYMADPTPKQSVTAWKNPEPCEALIDRVKATGFNAIRIPVTWFEHLQFDEVKNEYVVDEDWMDYVQRVVDWAYDRDMFIILNTHHESWLNVAQWTDETYVESSKKVHDIWSQVAERFKNYDQHLIFESLNEPRQTGNPSVSEWGGGDAYSWDYINKLNQVFVDVVRGTSEQNNERLLMLPTYDATCSITPLRALEIPEGSGNVALSVHAYVPYAFAMKADEKHIYEPGERDEWGNDLKTTLKTTMDDLHTISEEKNVPIIIGEFGASDFGNQEERVKWAEDYLTQATTYGFPCFLWDNNVVHYDGDELNGEKYECINRNNNALYPNNLPILEKIMSVVGVTDAEFYVAPADPFWDTFEIKPEWKTIKKLDFGEKIEGYQGSTLTSNYEYLKEGYRLAVAYEGSSLPKLIFVQYTSNGQDWSLGISAAKDSTTNIAYFDYSDIAKALEGHNLSDVANLTAQTQGQPMTVYGLFAVPLNPTEPSEKPSETSEPVTPSEGSEPTQPSEGSEPAQPSEGSEPTKPSEGSEPTQPSKGSEPATPSKGSEPTSPSKGSEPSIPSTVSTPQNPSGITVQSITLAYENVTLKKGNKEQLQYAIQPTEAANQKLIWSSSKEEVAYVDSSGVVYGLDVGEAIITVKTEDGGKQAFCKVTVTDTNAAITPSTPQITSLKPNKSSITLAVKKTFTIKVTIKPSGVTNKKLTYKSAKKSVATVSSSGVIKAVAPGKTTITVKSKNGKKTTVNVKVVPAKVSGVSAKQPAKGQIKVTWKKQRGISQYQISYYDPKKGSYTKPKTISKTFYTLKNCKKNATYKFKVRAIKKKDGTTYYGDYSSVVKIKAKK